MSSTLFVRWLVFVYTVIELTSARKTTLHTNVNNVKKPVCNLEKCRGFT